MAKKKIEPGKRRTREHVIADLSVNFVERQILMCGCTAEKIFHDYGIDLIMFTYNDGGVAEPGEVFLQLKATDKIKILKDGIRLSIPIERAHLKNWVKHWAPVILVVYDAKKDCAYWLYIQAAHQKKKFPVNSSKRVVPIHIPLANVLDTTAIKSFIQYKDNIISQQGSISHDW